MGSRGGKLEAGRPVWMRNHESLNEGGNREIERRGRVSKKAQQTVLCGTVQWIESSLSQLPVFQRPGAFCLLCTLDTAHSLHCKLQINNHLITKGPQHIATLIKHPWRAEVSLNESLPLCVHRSAWPFVGSWKGQGPGQGSAVFGCFYSSEGPHHLVSTQSFLSRHTS